MYTVLIEHVCVCICNPDAGNFIPSRPSFDGTLVPVHTQSLPGRKKMGFLGFLILLLYIVNSRITVSDKNRHACHSTFLNGNRRASRFRHGALRGISPASLSA